MSVRILLGDCREKLRELADESVHACVTDPPYHLTTGKKGGSGPASVNLESPYGRARIGTGFMGMKWDGGDVAFQPETWAEVLRVLKPGAHLLAFSGTRTYHRMACAIEDAGFEIRDQIGWLYGSGFPKSRNLAGDWEGWGTALKPAWEPIVMARKPFRGTVEANAKAHGCGALNIDWCRVEYAGTEDAAAAAAAAANSYAASMKEGRITVASNLPTVYDKPEFDPEKNGGRWPANVIHDGSEEVLAAFPDAPGQCAAVNGDEPTANGFSGAVKFGGMINRIGSAAPRGDVGSAARFFYCAKADRTDRDDGLEHHERVTTTDGRITPIDNTYLRGETKRGNHHPTVKPTDLMRYLCRLVTPKGGAVLDPFMGSGSTGRGAFLEGFDFIGIERDAAYVEIARARIRAIAPLLFVEEAAA